MATQQYAQSSHCTLSDCRGGSECQECSGQKHTFVSVDTNEYDDAVGQANKLHTDIMKMLLLFSFHNLVTSYVKTYYFKITRTDNKNGVLVCIPPYDLNSGYEVYTIINNKKDNNSCMKINNKKYCELVHYILHTLFNSEYQVLICNNIYEKCLQKINSSNNNNIFDDYIPIKNNNVFILLHKETQNGYMFTCYTDTMKTYIKLQIIQNTRYFEMHKTNFISTSFDSIYNKLLEYIKLQIHDTKISCCKVILSKYLEEDLENNFIEDNPSNININSDLDPY